MRLLDSLVMFWLVLWLVVGAWSGWTIWQLSELGDTVTRSGEALQVAGAALQDIGEIPVVGERPGELGAEVVPAATDIAERGQVVKGQLRQLALLLGISIVAIPTTPVVGLYLPLRMARRREIARIRGSLGAHDDPLLDRYLAERALGALPYATVRALSSDPWADVAQGRVRTLADAELDRLGIVRPVAPSQPG